jgi:hypothetical protein
MIIPFSLSLITNIASDPIDPARHSLTPPSAPLHTIQVIRVNKDIVLLDFANNIQQKEKVQNGAAHFATRNHHDRHPGSFTQMIQDLNWEPLQIRRLKISLALL